MTDTVLSNFQKLAKIQEELKAPKSQYNSFAKFNYRSCEDILEAAKPVVHKYECALIISDSLEYIGDRYYVKATASLWSQTDGVLIAEASAFGREEESKKGYDASQITGAASSYARKYALNGLFNIDDTKDADTDEHKNQVDSGPSKQVSTAKPIAGPSNLKASPEDPRCDVPGCSRTVFKSKEVVNRKHHKGHVICYYHSTNGSWEAMLNQPQTESWEEDIVVDEDEPSSYAIASQEGQ